MTVKVRAHESEEDDDNDRVELAKRFRAPFTVECDCPECGVLVSRNLMDNYLSYPVLNEWAAQCLVCSCGEEFYVDVKVAVTIEARELEEEEEEEE